MSIRKHILKSNTWIVLLSLFTLLLIGGSVIYIFEDTYYKTFEKDAILQEYAYEVQSLVDQYPFQNNTVTETDFNTLKDSLSRYNYQLYLSGGGRNHYDNLYHNQKETLELFKPRITSSDKSLLYVWEDKTIITRKSDSFNLIAIHNAGKYGLFKLDRGTFELLILSFLFVGIGSILVIMFISRFFTRRLVNQIMIPIQKLTKGAERIEQGNLDEGVSYGGETEFETVFHSFNKMQKSLKAGLEKNAAYEKARTDMISGISHDLRTPLTSVKGYIKGMKDGIANTPEKQENYLNIAYKKACDMEILLQKLFYFSKLETGNMPIYPVRTDLIVFLKEFIKENQEHYKENGLEMTLSLPEEDCFVQMDKEQMSRVLDNIIDNSIKYRSHNEVHVMTEVKRTNSHVILTITDDGEGVPEDKLPHLFEQFYRADEARSGKKIGNGLGLYISKYIVEQHEGTISARTKGGLSIEIVLPLCG